MANERRSDQRIPSKIVTELHSADSVITKVGFVRDLSLEGMSFETDGEFPEKTTVYLTFNLPVEVEGEIRYSKKTGTMRKYGIKFTKIKKEEKEHLEHYVKARFKK